MIGQVYPTGQNYPPPTDLITAPTAGTLMRGSYSLGMRIQDGGGMIMGLRAGITDRFAIPEHPIIPNFIESNFHYKYDIIHTDVKPENIVVGEYGDVLLLDWGLAKVQEAAEPETDGDEDSLDIDRKATIPRQGTPLYMSPEQVVGEELDHRTDIYSLGAILFEILTLQTLAWGDNMERLLNNTANGKHPAPSIIAPEREIPMALDTLCWRCIQRERDERVQSVLEIIHELLYWLWVESSQRPV